MRFDPAVIPFLKGEAFSNGLRLDIAVEERTVPDRLAVLDQMLANARVIHVGCCDHVPLIAEKIKRDTWLHGRLSRVAAACFGVDTSREGIRLMRDELGYADVACADITRDEIPALSGASWDYLLLGELIEHLDDPIQFLATLKKRYHGLVSKVIITVPNALCLLNSDHARRHKEFINSDHRHWFSPYTLAKQLVRAGIEPESFQFVELYPRPTDWRSRLSRAERRQTRLFRKYPALRECLMMVGTL